jgi:hypothetical protein
VIVGAKVRLVREFGSVPAGSEGVVFGFYRRPGSPEVAVAFEGDSRAVPADALEVVPDDEPRERGAKPF